MDDCYNPDLRLGDFVLTSFLRGVYGVTPDYLPIDTKTTYVQGPLTVGAALLGLAGAAERGELPELPDAPPDGAAGTRGERENLLCGRPTADRYRQRAAREV